MGTNLVNNTGTNYTLYYNILNYFKTIMGNHPGVSTATMGDITKFDMTQFPDYPIANLLISDASFGTNVTNYNVQLTVADKIKNKNNESSGSHNVQIIPFFGVNDVVDIHANTFGIINDLTSFTQRGVTGFDIDGEIEVIPFEDQFNNGLAGWVANFTLTTHNDKNRCLFFLVNPSGSGYKIQDCENGDEYYAVLNMSGSIGQVFSSITNNSLGPNTYTKQYDWTYDGLRCFTILEAIEDFNDWNYVNLPILALPYENYVTCEYCDLWINPKVWSTTPAKWGEGTNVDFRKWIYD